MHKFNRGSPPVDFKKLQKNHVNWESFIRTNEHMRIGVELYSRQSHYCAYCETLINQKSSGHIEHLERRSDNPNRTFDWSNMFFSCSHSDSCGKFKDNNKNKISFNPVDIVDPSCEDPLDYFYYDASNGQIHPKKIDPTIEKKAKETIRIFNLDLSPRLNNLRRNVATTISSFLPDIQTEEDIPAFLDLLGDCDCISVYSALLKER